MKKSTTIFNNLVEFLLFLRSRYPMFHNSNFFFRDLQYGVMDYLDKKKMNTAYGEAEKIAQEVALGLEKQGIFKRINQQAWIVNYSDFAAKKAS